jgi:hypothetical protein
VVAAERFHQLGWERAASSWRLPQSAVLTRSRVPVGKGVGSSPVRALRDDHTPEAGSSKGPSAEAAVMSGRARRRRSKSRFSRRRASWQRTAVGAPPPPRTDWTRLVPPPVLTGHVSPRTRWDVRPVLQASARTPASEDKGDSNDSRRRDAPQCMACFLRSHRARSTPHGRGAARRSSE